MKKITLSILAIAMTLVVVTTSASALFSSTATVSGVTFSTGNATLQVWDKTASAWASDFIPSDFIFQNMYPMYTTYQTFSLRNSSTSNISMKLHAKLRDGSVGAWDQLKDVVYVRITNDTGTVEKAGWATLNAWNATGSDFDTGLARNENRWYRFEVSVANVGNEISNLSLSGIKFDFTGTQE